MKSSSLVELIGYSLGLDAATVARHIDSISPKLGASSRMDLMRLLSTSTK